MPRDKKKSKPEKGLKIKHKMTPAIMIMKTKMKV